MIEQSDGHFAQVLEGRVQAVATVLEKIHRDRRHRDVRVLLEEPIDKRQFARWAMGLLRRDDMTEEMSRLHRDGCANDAEARAVLNLLMTRPPESVGTPIAARLRAMARMPRRHLWVSRAGASAKKGARQHRAARAWKPWSIDAILQPAPAQGAAARGTGFAPGESSPYQIASAQEPE